MSDWKDNHPSLATALNPLAGLLAMPDVTEISINKPQMVFIEKLGVATMQRVDIPEATEEWIKRLSERVASFSGQYVSDVTPILSAALPDGERFQAVIGSAAPDGGAISIRKQVTQNLTLDEYKAQGALDGVKVERHVGMTADEKRLADLLTAGDVHGFLKDAIRSRVSIVVSGGTSTGKTTFLNALLKEVPASERLVTIEDTQELEAPHNNLVRLIASKGGQGLAQVDAQALLEASLRMRPDRLLLGELRGKETFSFLQAINTGHPGSLTTVHANSPRSAYERLAMMVLQGGLSLDMKNIITYLKEVIPVVVQLGRVNGKRCVTEVLFTRMNENEAD